jgi:hypothetical protein
MVVAADSLASTSEVISSVQSTLFDVVVPVVVTVSDDVLDVEEFVLDVALLTVMIQVRYETSPRQDKSVKREAGPALCRPGLLSVSRAA